MNSSFSSIDQQIEMLKGFNNYVTAILLYFYNSQENYKLFDKHKL